MSLSSSQTLPFLADRAVLGDCVARDGTRSAVILEPLRPSEATALGHAFAAIEPWSKYPYPAAALASYFADGDHSAPRLALSIDGVTAGVVGLRLNWLCGPYLQFLGLLPTYQSLGLGAMALAWIDAQARSEEHTSELQSR